MDTETGATSHLPRKSTRDTLPVLLEKGVTPSTTVTGGWRTVVNGLTSTGTLVKLVCPSRSPITGVPSGVEY